MTVRAFAASDYPAVLAIDETEQRAYRGALWEAASEAERAAFLITSEGDIAEYVNRGICLVADRDAAVVWFLFALPLLPDVLYVDALAVAPEARASRRSKRPLSSAETARAVVGGKAHSRSDHARQ